MDHSTLLSILSIAASIHMGKGLECYICVYMPGGDPTCLSRPQDITDFNPKVKCENGDDICCTIIKVVDKDQEVVSFNRGCQANCKPMNNFNETTLGTQTMYQTHCDTPLCNVGPGDTPLSNIDDGDQDDNVINNIPGIGAAGSTSSQYIIIAICAAIMTVLNARY